MSAMLRSCALALMGVITAVMAQSAAQAQTVLRVPMVSRTIFYLPAWTAESRDSSSRKASM